VFHYLFTSEEEEEEDIEENLEDEDIEIHYSQDESTIISQGTQEFYESDSDKDKK
jgi:hypothetical protein